MPAIDVSGGLTLGLAQRGAVGFPLNAGNLIVGPDDFTNAAWTNNATTTADATTAPDGTLTADKLVPGNSSSSGWRAFQDPTSIAAARTYELYAKAAGYKRFAIRDSFATAAIAYFDTSTVSVISNSGFTTANITSVGNGWTKIVLTLSSAASVGMDIRFIPDTGTDYTVAWTPDGVSGLYFWHAQIY